MPREELRGGMKTHERFTQNRFVARPGVIPAEEQSTDLSPGGPALDSQAHIHIGKSLASLEKHPQGRAETFTMSLGTETIQLLPLKTWSQLDLFKWRVRGILPGTPVGLEITSDHIKIAGEAISTSDPEACEKLEKAFNDWLALEKQNLELAKLKTQSAKPPDTLTQPEEDAVRFKVETDKAGKPCLRCLEGKETVKLVAVNLQGFNALIEQHLLRRPQTLKVGALHNWVELDGQLVRFEEDTNWAVELEKLLNERYLPTPEPGAPPDIVASANPASPTGFDIQFPATPNGIAENHKYHLNEESIELLSDPQRCRVLRKGIIAKLTPPNLIFKQKLADGGERYLDPGPEATVSLPSQDRQTKQIMLSQPVDLRKINADELTAILNHPAINRQAKLAKPCPF
jgi:hypothetical protein